MDIDMRRVLDYCKGLRLLYVEDNDEARTYTQEMLSRFFDPITIATNGMEGLERFDAGTFDLVISDINMPRMDGIEMLRRIKERDDDIPVIMLSAHNELSYQESVHDSGALAYLKKPLSLEHLLEVLTKLMDREEGLR